MLREDIYDPLSVIAAVPHRTAQNAGRVNVKLPTAFIATYLRARQRPSWRSRAAFRRSAAPQRHRAGREEQRRHLSRGCKQERSSCDAATSGAQQPVVHRARQQRHTGVLCAPAAAVAVSLSASSTLLICQVIVDKPINTLLLDRPRGRTAAAKPARWTRPPWSAWAWPWSASRSTSPPPAWRARPPPA